jgi:hypothetical protein
VGSVSPLRCRLRRFRSRLVQVGHGELFEAQWALLPSRRQRVQGPIGADQQAVSSVALPRTDHVLSRREALTAAGWAVQQAVPCQDA